MSVNRHLLATGLSFGSAAILGMMFVFPDGKGLQYLTYFDILAVIISIVAANALMEFKGHYLGRCLVIFNSVIAIAIAFGHFNFFHIGIAQKYAASHIWGPVDGFLLATWVITACYLRKHTEK